MAIRAVHGSLLQNGRHGSGQTQILIGDTQIHRLLSLAPAGPGLAHSHRHRARHDVRLLRLLVLQAFAQPLAYLLQLRLETGAARA